MTVRVDLNVSLDGVAVPEDPMGEDWGRIVAAYLATKTMRERVLGETTGEGTTGLDDRYAAEYFEGVGAEIMGAGMFGLHTYADDPDWRGWWGEEPPFHGPVLVLSHRVLPPISFANGTTFSFVSGSPSSVLAQAISLAGVADVRIGGGVSVVRSFLTAGLVDRLHVAITPIVLGRGARLWDGLDLRDYSVSSEVADSGVVHVTYTR